MHFFKPSVVAGISMMILTACGSGNDPKPASQPVAAASCPASQVYTASGCLPQAGCQPGYGMFNNTNCVPGVAIANSQHCLAGQAFNPSVNQCVSTNNAQNGGYNPNTQYPGQYSNPYSNTQCGAGQVYSQQYNNCLTQAPCPTGFAMYNGSCTSVTNQNAGQYPQNCPTNTFATQYGCQAPGQCPYGSVYYQGQCQYGNYFNYGAGFGFHFNF